MVSLFRTGGDDKMIKDRIVDVYIITCLAVGTALIIPRLVYTAFKKDGWLRG